MDRVCGAQLGRVQGEMSSGSKRPVEAKRLD